MYKPGVCCALLICCGVASASEPTLIAPMIDGLRGCQSAAENPALTDAGKAWEYCSARDETAASLIDETLSRIGPRVSADGQFELGYMLNMPLLSYVTIDDGQVVIDREAIRQDLRLIEQSERSLVLYLFLNHFVGAGQVEIADRIAEDPRSMMRLADGSVPVDSYFSSSIYPWSLMDEKSLIEQVRKTAVTAVLEEVCRLPDMDRQKIRAVTTLGEIHHFFPDFMSGMGYGKTFDITDYSKHSIETFRRWLKERYSSIGEFNAVLSSHFESFEQVEPPSKNIDTQPLNSFFEHTDAQAHGVVPFFGWAYEKTGKPFDIHVYLNGQYIGSAETGLTRLDVAQNIDGLDDSNVGYRYDLDYSQLPPGIHEVELRFVSEGETSTLQNYDLAVMDRAQTTPEPMPQFRLAEADVPVPDSLRYWADYPQQTTAVFYNPLAKLWNEFRQHQVTGQIVTYADMIKGSCIAPEKVFSHQIGPEFNGSWNPTLLAANQSLENHESYALGVNLYGGIVYGDNFFDWLSEQGHERYGVPEMHPMTPQDPQALSAALRRHHEHGAVFLSPYFMSIQPERFGSDPEHDKFEVKPDNPSYGSSQFYEALQEIMRDTSRK